MKKLLLAAVMLVAAMVPAHAWESVEDMNRQIDETNFIVASGCSGTLISTDKRLVLTAHHCIDRYIKKVTRDKVGKDGKIEKVTFERRDRVTIKQKDYAKYENVGSVSYQTEIIAYLQERDLALLQLVGSNLRSTIHAPILPDSLDVLRGEPVTAVGNPLGFDATITSGVISSTNRTFQVPWALNEQVPMLQFDANVNGGNSGGGLFDSKGRLIGVVVAGVRGSDLSFAIPVFEVWDMLKANCLESVYNAGADDAACEAEGEETADGGHNASAPTALSGCGAVFFDPVIETFICED